MKLRICRYCQRIRPIHELQKGPVETFVCIKPDRDCQRIQEVRIASMLAEWASIGDDYQTQAELDQD